MKSYKILFVVSIGITLGIIAWNFKTEIEQDVVCFKPGLRACEDILGAPPPDFPEARIFPSSYSSLLASIPVLTVVEIEKYDGIYTDAVESINFYGPQRTRKSKNHGVIEIEWQKEHGFLVLCVKIESEKRTYWCRMGKIL